MEIYMARWYYDIDFGDMVALVPSRLQLHMVVDSLGYGKGYLRTMYGSFTTLTVF